MLKYVKKCQNNPSYSPPKPRPRQRPLCQLLQFKTSGEFVCTSDPGYNLHSPACFRSLFQCLLRHKRAVKQNPLESCFVFDRKMPEGGKRLFLFTFCFYFRLAWFNYWSLHPEVDNIKAGTSTWKSYRYEKVVIVNIPLIFP